MGHPSLTRRLWLAFLLMAGLTLLSSLIGWFGFRFIGEVEQTHTQSVIPTMNMARQLSEASAYELFSAQSLTNANTQAEWLDQGKMLTVQSLRISRLLGRLREQGFDTAAIEQQESDITRSLGLQGELVGQRLTLRKQQRELSREIMEAASRIAELAKGQLNNAATAAGVTQAGIYDLIDQHRNQAAEQALDRLIDVDLEYQNQMSELRLNAIQIEHLILLLEKEVAERAPAELVSRIGDYVRILQRRQERVEDPLTREKIGSELQIVARYQQLSALYQRERDIRAQLQALSQNNLDMFTRFSSEISRQVSDIERRNTQALETLKQARETGKFWLITLSLFTLVVLSLILWRVVWRSVTLPLAKQTAALQRLLQGDLNSPFPATSVVHELNTMGQLMEAFRANADALQNQQQYLAAQVELRTAELEALVVEHHQARAEAEKANRAKSAFLAAMSHEIRTPLHGVLGTAQLLSEQPLSAKSLAYVQAINDSGESLLAILNDILDYSALEAGKGSVTVSNEPFDPRQLLASIVRLISGRLRHRDIQLSLNCADDLPQWLNGDPRRIRQIVINLLSNALRFTEQGRIDVRCRVDGQRWQIDVADTGCGISAEGLTQMFKPFVQLTDKRGGTGLGLAISQGLTEALQGTLSATSTPGQGSCFSLSLPLQIATTPVQHRAEERTDLANYRLLIVEDNLVTQRITAEMLQSCGAEVEVASDGQSALGILAMDSTFSGVLVDLDLPDMDGITLSLQITVCCPQLPLIGFSAHVADEALRQRTTKVFRGLIQKPIAREELSRLIEHYLTADKKAQLPAGSLDTIQLTQDAAVFGKQKIGEWKDLFIEHAFPLVAEIEQAFAAGDEDLGARLAHKLKSGCASLGMQNSVQACAALEQGLRENVQLRQVVMEELRQLVVWVDEGCSGIQ
ncbi:TMAO reductase system sensor histidine kinase/response regulator TorS [Serratia fonticola]|uniref:TMAO reductase system sensor histidine kinase/response regulator TorS n=1 Tax=Serratia fonticola TaxID=47917 RepID=UPI00217A9817|nr:TMAO reductase system sensor histidine kinase/response regulator TorS [Serratia fonticola]CAI1967271.1 Sensor protein torS [Serratia fonticola]